MSPETEALLDTIAKLEAKAKGTTNPHEAEVFAAKVAELLAKHNLNEAMLRSRDASREQGPIGRHNFGQRVPDAWRENILHGVARVYFCRLTFGVKRGKPDPWDWRFNGREHNAIVAMAMAEYLFATVKRMAREHSPISSVQKNFRKGASDRLYKRLYEMAEAQRTESDGVGDGSGTALMIITEDKAIAVFLGEVKMFKGKTHRHGAGSVEGWEQAGKISLNTQVAETRNERLLS